MILLNRKSSTSVQKLWTVVVFSLLSLSVFASAMLDLNEPAPEDEFDADLDNYSIATEPTTTTTTTLKPEISGTGSQKSPKVTQAQYAKVQALFKVLAICDRPNFNMKTIQVPDSFTKENKAMMALKEVAKRNLIAKQDKQRYERIMKNCGLLAKAVHDRTDQALGPESQMSGGYDEDREAQMMYEMRNSPLNNLENRFSENNIASKGLSSDSIKTTTTTTTTTASPVSREIAQDGSTMMFKFL